MKRKAESKHSIDFLFIMFIFLVFTFSVISSLFLEINFYRSTVDMADENSNARIAVAYIRELVKQNDKENAISIGEFDGRECIMIWQAENYVLYVYEHNGELKELYARKDAVLTADDGKAVTRIASFKPEIINGNTLSVTCRDANGDLRRLIIGIKSGMGGN